MPFTRPSAWKKWPPEFDLSCLNVAQHAAKRFAPTFNILAETVYNSAFWRRGRVVEGTPLLREHTPKGYRKFESSRLRQNEKGTPDGVPFFIAGSQIELQEHS